MSTEYSGGGFGDPPPSNDPGTRRGKKLALQNVGPNNVSPTKGDTYDANAGSSPVAGFSQTDDFHMAHQIDSQAGDADLSKSWQAS
jgi:hypothetical protein